MNATLNYFMEANLGLIFFMILYKAGLKNENQFAFNRIYLLAAVLFSLSFPLIHLNSSVGEKVIPSVDRVLPAYWLPEVIVGNAGPGSPVVPAKVASVWSSVEVVYSLVAGSLLSILFVRIGSLSRLVWRSKKKRRNDCYVTESSDQKPTFSFFRFIFIGQAGDLSEIEKEEILRHEEVHVRRFHSLDILLINITACFFWFNPVISFYKKNLVQLHEFEADANAALAAGTDAYCNLLARLALQSSQFQLANRFTNSLTLQRINMMKTIKKKISTWKVVALLTAFVIFFFASACQDQVKSDLNEISKNSSAAGFIPSQVRTELEILQKNNPGSTYFVLQMNEDGQRTLEKLKREHEQNGSSFGTIKEVQTEKDSDGGGFAYLILEQGSQIARLGSSTVSSDSVYTVVDDLPEYIGGFDSLRSFLISHLKYPKEAVTQKLEGKVFVSFVITKEGKVINPSIAKGVSPQLDKAATEVVNSFPEWKPGRVKGQPVNVKFVIPINFKL